MISRSGSKKPMVGVAVSGQLRVGIESGQINQLIETAEEKKLRVSDWNQVDCATLLFGRSAR